MNAENGSLHLTLAITQLAILAGLWRASQRQDLTPTARHGLQFALIISLLAFLMQISFWLISKAPAAPLAVALRDGAIVVLIVSIFALLIGTLIWVLRGGLRPS
ncbi:MAG: hypothetical protein NZM28_10635 [Fimbriimonadales bacterium]|nr:hypothetical protein [Fimbriimonadales bacterium]